MDKITLLLEQEIQMRGFNVPIYNVGDAINFKTHMAAVPITRVFLQKEGLLEKDKESFMKIKRLIAYWYARGWIDPLPEYGQQLKIAKDEAFNPYSEGEYKQQYLKGAKVDQETLEMIQSYIEFTMMDLLSSRIPGLFAGMYIHGIGNVSGEYTPVERFYQLINAGGAKMAKDCFDLEYLDDDNKIQHLYLECFHILIFWTMKGWLKLPDLDETDPFANLKKN